MSHTPKPILIIKAPIVITMVRDLGYTVLSGSCVVASQGLSALDRAMYLSRPSKHLYPNIFLCGRPSDPQPEELKRICCYSRFFRNAEA